MGAYKKLTFKQALIVLGQGEQIQSAPDKNGVSTTFFVDENDDFYFENAGYMDLYEFSDEQWYAKLEVYEKLFAGSRQ